MTEWQNPWKEGDLIAVLRANGRKVITKRDIALDKDMTELTFEEGREVFRRLALYILMNDDPDPEFRRELLSQFDSCPCCQTWLGHNRPPDESPPTSGDSNPPRRQTSFDFKR
jgi:hypothetical protein